MCIHDPIATSTGNLHSAIVTTATQMLYSCITLIMTLMAWIDEHLSTMSSVEWRKVPLAVLTFRRHFLANFVCLRLRSLSCLALDGVTLSLIEQ